MRDQNAARSLTGRPGARGGKGSVGGAGRRAAEAAECPLQHRLAPQTTRTGVKTCLEVRLCPLPARRPPSAHKGQRGTVPGTRRGDRLGSRLWACSSTVQGPQGGGTRPRVPDGSAREAPDTPRGAPVTTELCPPKLHSPNSWGGCN